jgi:Holliday junction DNA helicase RuvA
MISQITGKVSRLSEDSITLFLNGLYYELMIPSGLYSQLKEAASKGSEITLFTLNFIEAGDRKSYHYPRLVGFTDPVDKEFFQVFTTVPGLGIRKALKSLTLPIREIATAIETKNAATLSRLPGIGGRLADKVIAELCGKMARFALSKGEHALTSVSKEESDLQLEAVEVFLQLQYSRVAAEAMVQKALAVNPKIKNSEALISAIFSQETAGGISR